MKRLIIDLDGTLTVDDESLAYSQKVPNGAVVEALRNYKSKGFEIVVNTSRNMNTFNQALGKINKHTLPVIIEWLNKHNIPYDEIFVGKPWCGKEGFYIDDKSIRPDEFVKLSYDEIKKLVGIN
jgi:capsule biosynthesis phosphatase